MNSIASPDRRQAIAAIVGSQTMAEFDAAWAAFSGLGHLRVTVYGPYDAGKTTLIKRLLTEDGTPVPDWLAISGRPETMTAAEAESGGIGYVDTPGTAGRSADHDRRADEALTLTDAVLFVLPQQRLHEDTARLAELAAAGFPTGALLVVIAQADTVGADPQSDLEEFQTLCQRRRAELLKVLPTDLAGTLGDAVYVVAADPYGEVANARQTDRGHYDSYRAWDGIAELRARLSALASRLPELRDAAGHRFWARTAVVARAEAGRELDRLEAVKAEAGKRREKQAMLEGELAAIDAAAAAALRQAIGDELNAVPHTAIGMDAGSVRIAIEKLLEDRVRAWQVTYYGRLQALAQQAELELAVQAADPGSVEYDQWLHELVMPPPRTPTGGSVADRVGAFSDPAAKAVEGAIRLRLRIPADEARDQLKFLDGLQKQAKRKYRVEVGKLNRNAPDFQDQRDKLKKESRGMVEDFFGDDSIFTDRDHVKHARTLISRMDIAAELVPAVMTLGGLLAQEVGDHRAATREREQRERVRQVAAAFTEQILGDSDNPAEGSWRHAVKSVRARLRADALLEPVAAAASERAEIIESARRNLR